MSKGKTPARRVVTTKKQSSPKSAKTTTSSKSQDVEVQLPFGRMNYILLLIGVAVIAFGFILMSMDDFIDATEFSVSLYIAPVVVVAGFVWVIYAIMYKEKGNSPDVESKEG